MSGSEQPRDSRSMASRRGGAARPAGGRPPAARDPETPPPLSAMRRAGVLVVVGALLISITLAMGGTSRPGPGADLTPPPSDTAAATATPAAPATPAPTGPVPQVVPVILPPTDDLITIRKAPLVVTLPEPGEPLRGLTLRIYRNDNPVMDPVKVRGLSFTVKDVPLRRGQNRLSVALVNAVGEGPRSEPVVIVVDDKAPRLEIKEPGDGTVVNSTLATVRGLTEPGIEVTVRNPGFGATETATADERGVFITEIRLDKGSNRLTIETVDAAGNPARQVLSVVRGDAEPQARLALSKDTLRQDQLPQAITIRLELRDPDGRPVDGATVSFTLSPPGLDTRTYTTTTDAGIARWEGVLIQGARKGNGWVTARAELGGGLASALVTKPLTIE